MEHEFVTIYKHQNVGLRLTDKINQLKIFHPLDHINLSSHKIQIKLHNISLRKKNFMEKLT